jgi:hypothetical protein
MVVVAVMLVGVAVIGTHMSVAAEPLDPLLDNLYNALATTFHVPLGSKPNDPSTLLA